MRQEAETQKDEHTPAWAAFWPALAVVPVLFLMMLELRCQGRSWGCACGQWWPWAGNVLGSHNSQHFADPYSFTHVLHGVLFCGVLALAARRLPWMWRFFLAILLEAGWEVLENSAFVIERYRQATMALGYTGDSITNSVGDAVFCGMGFMIARYLGFWRSAAFFVLTECVLLLCIHDNLTLNIVMLVWPVDAIKVWQMAH